MATYDTFRMTIKGQVATVTLIPPASLGRGTGDLHWQLGELFSELRGNNAIRLVILTGEDGQFYRPRPKTWYNKETTRYMVEPAESWRTFTGVLRTHQAMAEIEKPIIAKVNGDAVGFGSSLVFACDFIVAVNDASFMDIHLAMGEDERSGPPYGLVPGDGGAPLMPLFMSPVLAKQYLMLSDPFTGRELSQRGVINYAVAPEELDAKVDELSARLLKRSAHALAWTKRAVNRTVVDALNRGLDASAAYEMVGLLQLHYANWEDNLTLDK
jgi:enoyl-CoA hydratase